MACVIYGSDRQKVRQIIRTLRDTGVFPFREMIIGSLQNVLRNIIDVTLEVDRWPDFTTIISRLHMPQLIEGEHENQVPLQCYSTNPEQLEALLKTTSVVPWEKNCNICVSVSLELIWLSAVQTRGGTMIREEGMTFHVYAQQYYDPNQLYFSTDRKLPPGYSIGRLRLTDAAIVNKCWKLGGTKRAEASIRFCIENLPSICIFNESGEPVSWNNTHMDGSAAIGHTLPEYRRRGLYKINIAEINFRHSQAKMVTCGYTLVDNTAANKASQGTPWPEKVIFGVYSPASSKL